MNVKYYAREGKTDAKIQICLIHSRTQTLRVTTRHVIPIGVWDKSSQQVNTKVNGADELNETLLQDKLDVLKQYRTLNLNGITNWSDLTPRLKNYIKTGSVELESIQTTEEKLGLEEAIRRFLIAKEVEYKPETNRKYSVLLTVWQHFEKHRKKRVYVSKLSYSIVEEFRHYLLTVRNNRNDTVYKMLASLKSLIRWLIQNDYPVDPKCMEVRQKVRVKHEIVTLSEVEILKLKQATLKQEHQIIRDCFLFQLYTGQRFSDMQQLSPEQINGDVWRFQSIKTGKDMTVPFVGWGRTAFEVAHRYDFSFPQYAPQYFNRALKKICELAGIDETVTLKRFNGSKEVTITEPKCKLVSSHTARRTCVSQLLAKGVPPTIVMKLTGHSSIQTMMRYERTSNDSVMAALSVL